MYPLLQKFRARFRRGLPVRRGNFAGRGVRVKKTVRVRGLVQVIAQTVLQLFGQEFQALFRGHNLRVQVLEVLLQRGGLPAKVIQLALRPGSGCSLALEKRGERAVAVTCA